MSKELQFLTEGQAVSADDWSCIEVDGADDWSCIEVDGADDWSCIEL